MNEYDVVGIGQICLDYLGMIEAFPNVDQRVRIDGLTTCRGGPTATALNVLSNFGLRTAIISKIGGDDIGRRLKAETEQAGISTSFLITEPDAQSQISLIPIEYGTGKRTVFWSRGTVSALKPHEIDSELLKRCSALHLDDLYIDTALDAVIEARKHGTVISVDASDYRPSTDRLKGNVDILIVSHNFAEQYCGELDPKKNIYDLKDFQAAVTTITHGSKGSITLYNDELIETPGYEITPVDTTGAGDVFRGAFLYGRLKGWQCRDSLEFASAAAAMSTLVCGAVNGIPDTPEEVFEFMKKQARLST